MLQGKVKAIDHGQTINLAICSWETNGSLFLRLLAICFCKDHLQSILEKTIDNLFLRRPLAVLFLRDIGKLINLFYLFQVKIGNFERTIGKLKYTTRDGGGQSTADWIIGVAVGGAVLMTIIIIILIIYKRKSTEAERQYKKMQIQLDTLESNVRNECKQGMYHD